MLKVCNHQKKIIEYLKNILESNGILFLQETHSISNDEKAWAGDFKGQLFLSHGTSNSHGALIAYLGSKSFVAKNKRNGDAGQILIVNASIDNTDYILVNIYTMQTRKMNKLRSRIISTFFLIV